MADKIPCPGWTSVEDQSVHRCDEGRVDQTLVSPPGPCARCRKRWHKYDEERGARARREVDDAIREQERMGLYIGDLAERGFPRKGATALSSVALPDLIRAIEALESRGHFAPHNKSGQSWDAPKPWDVLRAYAGLPALPRRR